MQIIQFKENQKEIWNRFIAENNSESFLQVWEWGEFQKSLGRKMWRIGVIEDDLFSEDKTSKLQITNYKSQINSKFKHTPSASQPTPLKRGITNSKLLAVALIIKYNLPFGKNYFYCPRGPVINESRINLEHSGQESRILDLLFDEIKKIAKKEKTMFLRIDPPIKTDQESGIMNYECFSNLKKSPNEIQPKNTLILDLTKSEGELLKEMKQKTRYNIRLAGKKELRITSLAYWQAGQELRMDNKKVFKEKFEEFWKLTKETSRRDKFSSHNKNYYWKMLESLSECDINEGEQTFVRLQARLYLAEYNNKIIAANIVLFFGDVAVYLHGASSNEHRNLMAPYLLQWRQILDAKKAGCKRYDFWGVSATKATLANVNFVSDTWGGITRFKKGFGGGEKNNIGAYDLVFDNIGYAIYRFMRKIKDILKF
jgi:lipid II:glycine glycyltransferase (peptidoglycan interpeptide bridge formation enzyme)